jgi:hypothetical protein
MGACNGNDRHRSKEEKAESKVDRKSKTERDLENVVDKIKAGARALANKVDDAGRELDAEYRKKKVKEKLD